jgi:hypothetical protein
MWVKGVGSFLFLISIPRPIEERRNRYEVIITKGKMRRTIHCVPNGNPETAAGPKARAVFMPAPV